MFRLCWIFSAVLLSVSYCHAGFKECFGLACRALHTEAPKQHRQLFSRPQVLIPNALGRAKPRAVMKIEIPLSPKTIYWMQDLTTKYPTLQGHPTLKGVLAQVRVENQEWVTRNIAWLVELSEDPVGAVALCGGLAAFYSKTLLHKWEKKYGVGAKEGKIGTTRRGLHTDAAQQHWQLPIRRLHPPKALVHLPRIPEEPTPSAVMLIVQKPSAVTLCAKTFEAPLPPQSIFWIRYLTAKYGTLQDRQKIMGFLSQVRIENQEWVEQSIAKLVETHENPLEAISICGTMGILYSNHRCNRAWEEVTKQVCQGHVTVPVLRAHFIKTHSIVTSL